MYTLHVNQGKITEFKTLNAALAYYRRLAANQVIYTARVLLDGKLVHSII